MAEGISAVLTFAVGVAISPVPIIAVTLMLFSQRARVNGPAFLVAWVLALALVSGVAYVLADQADAATSSTATDTIAWGKGEAAVANRLVTVAEACVPSAAILSARAVWPAERLGTTTGRRCPRT
jgi:Sap-like sulfolipid-1-addressing protein